jgi:hypothetical protein
LRLAEKKSGTDFVRKVKKIVLHCRQIFQTTNNYDFEILLNIHPKFLIDEFPFKKKLQSCMSEDPD